MLVQVRKDQSCWCITQHDHARLSGFLAHHWGGLGDEPCSLSWGLVQAITLHDLPWLQEDLTPRYNPDTKLPYSFVDFPWEDRVNLYDQGLHELSLMDPEVALLVSLHYASFKGTLKMHDFQEQEHNRRQTLRAQLSPDSDDQDESLQSDLAYLQMFDMLSLVLCLKGPLAEESHWPRWLLPDNSFPSPTGRAIHIQWLDENHITCDPFPWREPLCFSMPFRRLEGTSFADESTLLDAWNQADCSFSLLTISPPGTRTRTRSELISYRR